MKVCLCCVGILGWARKVVFCRRAGRRTVSRDSSSCFDDAETGEAIAIVGVGGSLRSRALAG